MGCEKEDKCGKNGEYSSRFFAFSKLIAIFFVACLVISIFLFYKGQCVLVDAYDEAANAIMECADGTGGITESADETKKDEAADNESAVAVTVAEISDNQKESSNDNNDNTDTVSQLVEYLEKLTTIQKNATSNDVMAFIYSVLCAILIGIGALVVEKCWKNADEAEKSAKAAEEKAGSAEQAQKAAEQAQKAAEQAVKSAKESAENYKKQVDYQSYVMKILTIRTEILYAKNDLFLRNKAGALEHFQKIKDRLYEIDKVVDKDLLSQLKDELNGLYDNIDDFESYVKVTYGKDPKRLANYNTAIQQYKDYLEEAVDICKSKL